jgi:FtsP/CotA-like multicopper oxidase with cupredoxin domain
MARHRKRKMWNEMRMSPTDLADLSSAVLTIWSTAARRRQLDGLFRPGERVRLRFINGAAIPSMTCASLAETHGGAGRRADVEPVTVDEFRFGPGETYDVIVQPRDDAYTIFAQSMDRTGYARATLAVRPG